MKTRISRWMELVRTGFWFVPTAMLVVSAGFAILLLHVDERVDPGLTETLSWAYSGGAEGARSLLSTVAGSMITAASVTFSLASVALSIASQQYGSRVLRNFMRDRITQVLLGTFVATFVYCVLVVRTIRGSNYGGGFVPSVSVTVAIGLSLVSLVMLIYFIHHVSSSIQASHIIRVIAEEIESAIPKLYPSEAGDPLRSSEQLLEMRSKGTAAVAVEKSGYLQSIDLGVLMKIAVEHDLIANVLVKPGDHLLAGTSVAELWGAQPVSLKSMHTLIDAFYIGRERTPAQDIRYQFQQLTDVIVRALSPGINDPFTAINGIDELASAIQLLTRRAKVQEQRRDDSGALRLIVPTASVGEILEQTVEHIAVYAKDDSFVMTRLRRALDSTTRNLPDPEDAARAERLKRHVN